MSLKRIDLAMQTAIDAHQGEYRKGNDQIPYVLHCFDNANTLHNFGFNEDIIIAGLLHDTVEHKKLSIEEINKTFGFKIGAIIKDCTIPEDGSWTEAREKYMKRLSMSSDEIKAVVLADKISNLKETYRYLQKGNSKIWNIFKTGKEGQIWYFNELKRVLKIEHPIYDEFIIWFNKVFND